MLRWAHDRGSVILVTSLTSTGPYTKWCRLISWPFSRKPVYPRKWAPAKTCTCPYYASVFWSGDKLLQSNAAAKMCTNRDFRHPTHCILHTQFFFAHGGQNLLLSFDCRSDWFWGFFTLLRYINCRNANWKLVELCRSVLRAVFHVFHFVSASLVHGVSFSFVLHERSQQ